MEKARDDPSMGVGNSQEQKLGHYGCRKRQIESPLCSIDGHLSPQKMWSWSRSTMLRGDIVKDDSGSYAVFTEQGSSASQMTAAKIMDIISRLPGCDGQAADAVSAYTQVKMEDAHNY